MLNQNLSIIIKPSLNQSTDLSGSCRWQAGGGGSGRLLLFTSSITQGEFGIQLSGVKSPKCISIYAHLLCFIGGVGMGNFLSPGSPGLPIYLLYSINVFLLPYPLILINIIKHLSLISHHPHLPSILSFHSMPTYQQKLYSLP